jgi:SAM-dependent methyltransferase
MAEYHDGFYTSLEEGEQESAEVIVPLILDLAGPASVVDIGCGSGAWLTSFQRHGVSDYLGVDFHALPQDLLRVPLDRYLRADLSKPFRLPRTFDLVVSLEVAEHLPPESADIFVDTLASLGPVVLFSAALPLQQGFGHINERWPSYWASKFRQRGFEVADPIRPRAWNDPRVDFWYAQNCLVFVRRDALDSHPKLAAWVNRTDPNMLSLVHPRLYLDRSRRVDSAVTRLITRWVARSPTLWGRLSQKRRQRIKALPYPDEITVAPPSERAR